MMNKSMVAGLCATVAVLVSGAASAAAPHAQLYRPQAPLPALYITASLAQAACPTDKVLWVNTSARVSHEFADKYYGHTVAGAYACATDSSAAGIAPSAD